MGSILNLCKNNDKSQEQISEEQNEQLLNKNKQLQTNQNIHKNQKQNISQQQNQNKEEQINNNKEDEEEKKQQLQEQKPLINIKLNIESYTDILKQQNLRSFGLIKNHDNPTLQEHFYHSYFKKNNSNQKKTARLNKELIQLQRNLPVYQTNAIFVVYDTNRVDVMKGIIIGSQDTPYADGIYMYDVFFEDNYPIGPPKINLVTTGNGSIRFNPNLYNNGYVCLSLLGTWRGNAIESWSPATSNLNQAMISIQSIVMNDDIYFNEPSYEKDKGTPLGENYNQGYSNIVKYGNIKFAMIEMINNPPAPFADIIKVHFYLKKDSILKNMSKWLEEAQNSGKNANYQGLVHIHNQKYATQFQQKGQFYLWLNTEVEELKKALNNIKQEEVIAIINKWGFNV